MTNIAYLMKISGNSKEKIFEANISIPIFWYNLLDLSIMENVEKKYLECHKYEDYKYFTIKIMKKIFIGNLQARKDFVKHNYIDKIILYNDFINYLDIIFKETDILEFNILNDEEFNKNIIDTIRNILININSKKATLIQSTLYEDITSFIGYDDFFDIHFKKYSKEYLEYSKNIINYKDKEIFKKIFKLRTYGVKERVSDISLIILGMIMIIQSVTGLIKRGEYIWGIISIVLGLISLLTGLGSLKDNMKGDSH